MPEHHRTPQLLRVTTGLLLNKRSFLAYQLRSHTSAHASTTRCKPTAAYAAHQECRAAHLRTAEAGAASAEPGRAGAAGVAAAAGPTQAPTAWLGACCCLRRARGELLSLPQAPLCSLPAEEASLWLVQNLRLASLGQQLQSGGCSEARMGADWVDLVRVQSCWKPWHHSASPAAWGVHFPVAGMSEKAAGAEGQLLWQPRA